MILANSKENKKPETDVHSAGQKRFEKAALDAGLDPNDKWIGGYVDYEWTHLKPLLESYGLGLSNEKTLEFGCNVGASSIIMSAMGCDVHGIDVDAQMIEVAKANVDRHGMNDKISISHVADTRTQPFGDETFDFVLANSVLEYVEPDELAEVLKEIHRVMKPGAKLFICGTASRLSPKEVHSGRWIINYIPRYFDRLVGRNYQRGLSPLLLAKSMRGLFEEASGRGWSKGRLAVHGHVSLPMKIFDVIGRMLAIGPGWLSPNIELLFRKL